MPRKTRHAVDGLTQRVDASMRPRPDAAENTQQSLAEVRSEVMLQ